MLLDISKFIYKSYISDVYIFNYFLNKDIKFTGKVKRLAICDSFKNNCKIDLSKVECEELSWNNPSNDCINNYTLPINLKILDIKGRKTNLDSIPYNYLPNSLKNLRCEYTKITKLPDNLPNSLEKIYFSSNKKLTSLDNVKFPDSLISISFTYGILTKLPDDLPINLQELICYNNKLKSLDNVKFPDTLVELHVDDNEIRYLPKLPNSLKRLHCGDNLLTKLPKLPDSLEKLDFYRNYITKIPKLPNSLENMEFYGNPIEEIPKLPNSIYKIWAHDCELIKLPDNFNINQFRTLEIYIKDFGFIQCEEDYKKYLDSPIYYDHFINDMINTLGHNDIKKLYKYYLLDNKPYNYVKYENDEFWFNQNINNPMNQLLKDLIKDLNIINR